jgi:hypothetical protein
MRIPEVPQEVAGKIESGPGRPSTARRYARFEHDGKKLPFRQGGGADPEQPLAWTFRRMKLPD